MALQVACEPFIEFEDVTCDCGDTSEVAIEGLIDQASDVIAILTEGKVAGRCTRIVRPCGGCPCSCGSASLSGCGCVPLNGIPLTGLELTVEEILIDGVIFEDYALIDGNLLVRTDGEAWPGSQDITLASSLPGTFEIEYTSGILPQLAKDAAAEIVCSMLRNDPQDSRKGHPNTRSMNISGVQITLDQMAGEIKRRAPMLPALIRLLTIYHPQPDVVVYSPELDCWRLPTVDHFPVGS